MGLTYKESESITFRIEKEKKTEVMKRAKRERKTVSELMREFVNSELD